MEAKLFERFKKVEEGIWELPKTYRKGMKVPVRIVATEKILKELDDGAVDQAVNVAQLPGIVGASWMMPDAHWGYGFPVGGVAAFDLETGIISPGGIGFDINCGMRLLITNLSEKDIKPKISKLIDHLFSSIPIGVGASGSIRLNTSEFKEVMFKGASWAIEKDLGWDEDIFAIEENGVISGADPDAISEKATLRGINQLGTLGSGNHYLEVQKVERVFDSKRASEWGIESEGQVAVMIHCGSRGFGHQVGSDYLSLFEKAMEKYGIKVPDRQLACAPINSPEGKRYLSAMACAANNAFCNRQIITHKVREVFSYIFGVSPRKLGMKLVYDVAHNIAKKESYKVSETGSEINSTKDKEIKNFEKDLMVHRKGATRAFPDQPVIIGGSMETGSFLLVGTLDAVKKTFGSTAHGSGRTMSRTRAKKIIEGRSLQKNMLSRGIYVKSASFSGLAEEAGIAYKDISEVVKSVSLANISQPVVSFKPLGNIKG